jgi:hypothetical protein
MAVTPFSIEVDMRQRAILLTLFAATTLLVGAEPNKYKLVDRWIDPDLERRQFKKLLVIAITDDREVRRNFENRFVSHLRGRQIEGVTSHSMVTDLTAVEGEDQIVEHIRQQQIDGAISVRLVALGKKHQSEEAWSEAWRGAAEADGDLRTLIDDSLPMAEVEAKRFGIEVALWETRDWDRIWSGRTVGYTRKQLKKGAADFVQYVMHILKTDDLL